MDNKEQQEQELEALESIFSQEYKLLTKEPFGSFQFDLKTSDYDSNPKEGAKLSLKFTYIANYPDEVPNVEVLESQNFYDEKDTIATINSIATENLGMPMVYTIIFALMEKLEAYNETRKQVEAETKARLEHEREMEELRRFEGTKVNVASFLKWKAKFDEEMRDKTHKVVDTTNKKLTGKELFERSDDFVNSDLQFIAENEGAIEVDESLFQNMEDIDIDDSEDFKLDDDDDDDEDDDTEEEE